MVLIDKTTCIGCGSCVADCISMSLYLQKQKAEYTGQCIHCGHCVAICPTNAVTIPEYDMADVEPVPSDRIPVQDLLGAIKSRRSIRHYQNQPVERQKLENILQAGRYTATAVNRQACRFILVQDRLAELKQHIWTDVEKAVASGVEDAQPLKRLVDLRAEKGIDYLFRDAPAVLYIAAQNLWDAGMAAQNMELAALSQGLGVLYNGYLVRATRQSETSKELLQTQGTPLATCMLLGYPAVQYYRTAPRKPADAIWL